MLSVVEKLVTVEEYFALERRSEIRHEFVEGVLIPMPGESRINNEIALNCYSALRPQLRSQGCKIYTHDVRLIIKPGKIYRYPDLVVTCADEPDSHAVTQPTLIIEVLSESTAVTDRDAKLREYTSLPSLHYYFLVSAQESLIECYIRENQTWQYQYFTALTESIPLDFLRAQLPLSAVYEGISFEEKK